MRLQISVTKKILRLLTFYIKRRQPNPAVLPKTKILNINDKTAKTKAICGFPILRTDKPSFFRGFNEESESPYNSKSIDE